MKKIAKFVFKIHRIIYRYPMRSEIRLVLEYHDLIGSLWYIGMLYICGESISEIAVLMGVSKQEVMDSLNRIASLSDL
jgi:hypothetical protein